jgi:dTDP-4-amino-4,6-dideoxygalactose transaminase
VAFTAVLKTGTFLGGLVVKNFEREFARSCDARYCVGVSSGTNALRLALIAVGVRPGDSVLMPANAAMATVEAIYRAGARPAFC